MIVRRVRFVQYMLRISARYTCWLGVTPFARMERRGSNWLSWTAIFSGGGEGRKRSFAICLNCHFPLSEFLSEKPLLTLCAHMHRALMPSDLHALTPALVPPVEPNASAHVVSFREFAFFLSHSFDYAKPFHRRVKSYQRTSDDLHVLQVSTLLQIISVPSGLVPSLHVVGETSMARLWTLGGTITATIFVLLLEVRAE